MGERHTSSERSNACVAVGHAGSVLLLDIATGRLLWERALAEFPAGLPCDGQPVTVRLIADTVIAASMGHVFALSAFDGSLIWQVNRRGRGGGETCLAVSED